MKMNLPIKTEEQYAIIGRNHSTTKDGTHAFRVFGTKAGNAMLSSTSFVDVALETERQVELWGIQNYSPSEWISILVEEVGEVAKNITDGFYDEFDEENYRNELVQVAAVAISAIESLDREGEEQA